MTIPVRSRRIASLIIPLTVILSCTYESEIGYQNIINDHSSNSALLKEDTDQNSITPDISYEERQISTDAKSESKYQEALQSDNITREIIIDYESKMLEYDNYQQQATVTKVSETEVKQIVAGTETKVSDNEVKQIVSDIETKSTDGEFKQIFAGTDTKTTVTETESKYGEIQSTDRMIIDVETKESEYTTTTKIQDITVDMKVLP